MNSSIAQTIHWLVRIVLGGLFIYAGLLKLRGAAEFSDAIVGFEILPKFLVNITAFTVPVLEIVLGVMILAPQKTLLRIGALGLVLLNLVFLVVLSLAWLRGLNVDCGCFGFEASTPSQWKLPVAIFRDLLFLGAAVFLWMSVRILPSDAWILFYDGECAFCLKSIKMVARADKLARISFASLHGEFAHEKGFSKYATLNGGTVVSLRESDQKVYLYSDAWIELSRSLGGLWGLLTVLRLVPKTLRDMLYRWVARNRYRIIRKSVSCDLPDAEVLKRLRD